MDRPRKLTIAMTHPVQYYSPWFRHIATSCPELDLTVVYATIPSSEQQGVGFGVSFEWDSSPLDGYRHVVVRQSKKSDYFHSDRFFGLNISGIGAAVRDSTPDAVLIPGWYSVTLVRALVAARTHHIPAIYRGDSVLPRSMGRRASRIQDIRTRTMLGLFKAYLSVGIGNRKYLEHFGIDDSQIFFSPHCVDNEFFGAALSLRKGPERAEIRDSLGIPPDDFVVLFIGKLDQNKRAQDAIAATARLGARVTTLIVGKGPEESRCRAEAERLGVKVVFAGFINQSGLPRIYAAADVCILPSVSETWGLVVNESLAAGTPCVVSDGVGCAPDLIDPGKTGYVFPVGNTSECAGALMRIRDAVASGHDYSTDCLRVVNRYSFAEATAGLVAAVDSVMNRATAS
jgi:glycosyltransferase involved in cell wall biosynthesis